MFGIGSQELLLFFLLVAPYLVASVFLVPYVASQKGRSGFGWFWLAVLVTPVLALLALAALSEKQEHPARSLGSPAPAHRPQ